MATHPSQDFLHPLFALQTLANSSPAIIFTKDRNGRFLFMNAAGTNLLGKSLEDMIGKTETDLFGPRAEFESWESDHEVLSSGKPQSTRSSWMINDQPFALQLIKHPITDPKGHIVGILGIGSLQNSEGIGAVNNSPLSPPSQPMIGQKQHKDGPDLHRPELNAHAARSQTHYSSSPPNRLLLTLQSAMLAVASSLDVQHIVDTLIWEMSQLLQVENCIAFTWNQEKSEITFMGAYQRKEDVVHTNTFKLDQYPLFQQVISERRPFQMVIAKLKPTLNEFTFLARMGLQSLLLLPMVYHEEVVGLVGLAENQKQRVFSDQEISLAQMLVSQAANSIVNARLYAEIDKANHALQVSNEELKAFAHTVAHDLKGPIGRMMGFSEIILRDRERMSTEELDDFLQIIANNSQKMNGIVDALLLLSTVRQKDVQRAPVDMMSCLLEAKLRVDLQYTDQHVEILVPETLPTSWGYAAWITEVWVNYLSNAIKYGGNPPTIQVGATAQDDGKVRYWVRDNGQGLTPEQCAQLFTPFTRFHEVHAPGHGLGLSIVHRIIEKLGGEVGVESQVGFGSTFYFILPNHLEEFKPDTNTGSHR